MGRRILAAVALLALAASASAGIVLADPTVVHMSTFGYWEAGQRHGTYRIALLNVGFEHPTYRAIAEWLTEPSAPGGLPQVAWSVTLVDACLCAFDPPRITNSKAGVVVELSGENNAGGKVKCAFTLGQSGNVVEAQRC